MEDALKGSLIAAVVATVLFTLFDVASSDWTIGVDTLVGALMYLVAFFVVFHLLNLIIARWR